MLCGQATALSCACEASPVRSVDHATILFAADGLYDCAWSEDNDRHLASVSGDGTIQLWDLAQASDLKARAAPLYGLVALSLDLAGGPRKDVHLLGQSQLANILAAKPTLMTLWVAPVAAALPLPRTGPPPAPDRSASISDEFS